MSIEDRDWFRKDSERRRKQIEMDEKEDLRRKRQMGADAMWNEVEPSKKTVDQQPTSRPKSTYVDRRKIYSTLKRIPGYKKILSDCIIQNHEDRVQFDYLLIHEAGLFLFRICDDYRVVQAENGAHNWIVEDYTSLGYSRYQERPTIQLEKDHAVFDNAVRNITHVKSFAYLVFPKSGGLDMVSGNHNQLTTDRNLLATLKSDIQYYGHAYNKQEIDYLYSIITSTLSPSTSSRKTVYSPPSRVKKGRSPFWMRMIQVIGAVAVAAVVFLIIANSEWGSTFLQQNKIQLPSFQLPSAAEKAAEQRAEARSNPTSNTAVIPPNLVYDKSTQEEYDHFAKEYGLAAVEKGKDGSLTLSSDSNIMHANVDALVAVLSKKCGESGYIHLSSISVNEDHTIFTIVVNDVNISAEEKQVVTDLFLMAGLEAVQTDMKAQNIRVETANKLGAILSTRDTNPDSNAPLQAASASVTPTPASQAIHISSSRILKEPSYEGTCPFTIVLPSGDKDYYIYLKYLEPSEKSVTDRDKISSGDIDDVAIYIKATETFSCKVPVGVYQLFYTLGDTWYGPDEQFGTGSPTYKSDDLLEFYNEGNRWMGHTIELRPVRNGNLDRTRISRSEFPS